MGHRGCDVCVDGQMWGVGMGRLQMETCTLTFEAWRCARSHGWVSFCVNAPSSSRVEYIPDVCMCVSEMEGAEVGGQGARSTSSS